MTRCLDNLVRDNGLDIYVNATFIGASMESDRLKLLTVKFQTPEGVGLAYALQNENLVLDRKSTGFAPDRALRIVGAYYGNEKEYSFAMQKMEHYEYFKWDRIPVNHEVFPSSTASDDTEYLTLVYLNAEGFIRYCCCVEFFKQASNNRSIGSKGKQKTQRDNYPDIILPTFAEFVFIQRLQSQNVSISFNSSAERISCRNRVDTKFFTFPP